MSTYKANKASAVASEYMTTVAIKNGQRIGPLQLMYSPYIPMAKRVVYNPRTDMHIVSTMATVRFSMQGFTVEEKLKLDPHQKAFNFQIETGNLKEVTYQVSTNVPGQCSIAFQPNLRQFFYHLKCP